MSSLDVSVFKERIENVIDTGNIDALKSIINFYKDTVDKKYILMVEEMLHNLIEEKFEDMLI